MQHTRVLVLFVDCGGFAGLEILPRVVSMAYGLLNACSLVPNTSI